MFVFYKINTLKSRKVNCRAKCVNRKTIYIQHFRNDIQEMMLGQLDSSAGKKTLAAKSDGLSLIPTDPMEGENEFPYCDPRTAPPPRRKG